MLENFKKKWEITSNWQLIFPFLGIIGLFYSSYKLATIFTIDSLIFNIAITIALSFILLKFTLFLFKKLENPSNASEDYNNSLTYNANQNKYVE